MLATITNTQGIIALGAAAVGLAALLGGALLSLRLRRLRAAQRTVLGAGGAQDLVAHAAAMQAAFEALQEQVDETASRLDARLAGTEVGLRGAISHRALVRYDAYNE